MRGVSILVLVDAALRLRDRRRNYIRDVRVSILVLVDAALRLRLISNVPERTGVSILVLVDAALRHQMVYFKLDVHYCFNPCFSGCRPATSDS